MQTSQMPAGPDPSPVLVTASSAQCPTQTALQCWLLLQLRAREGGCEGQVPRGQRWQRSLCQKSPERLPQGGEVCVPLESFKAPSLLPIEKQDHWVGGESGDRQDKRQERMKVIQATEPSHGLWQEETFFKAGSR